METVTFTPYRYAKAGQVMRHTTAGDGYKRRADRLAEACGLRWVHRARGYVGTATQCDRVARLLAAGWDARLMLWKGQDFGPGPDKLPEPWMKRRAGLWVPPQAPTPAPTSTPATRARATISQAQTAAAVARVAAVVRDSVARGGQFRARAQGAALYAREGEDQAEAVRRLMAATKRRHKAPDPRSFPTYSPGMSTAEYVARYECANAARSRLTGETPDGQNQGSFWAPLNTAPAALYEGGALDFEAVAEVVADTPASVQPAAPAAATLAGHAPAAAAAPAALLSVPHPARLRGHHTRWLRAPAQEWRVWCSRRELAPLAHLAGSSGASLRRVTAGLAAVQQLAAVVDMAAPWRHLAGPPGARAGPLRLAA